MRHTVVTAGQLTARVQLVEQQHTRLEQRATLEQHASLKQPTRHAGRTAAGDAITPDDHAVAALTRDAARAVTVVADAVSAIGVRLDTDARTTALDRTAVDLTASKVTATDLARSIAIDLVDIIDDLDRLAATIDDLVHQTNRRRHDRAARTNTGDTSD